MKKIFKVVIEAEPSEGGFSAHVPLLPGCASQGETIAETVKNIKEAIELYVETLKDSRLPIPSADVKVVTREIAINV